MKASNVNIAKNERRFLTNFEVGQRAKKVFDIITAIILLPVVAPIMGLIAIAIKIDSRGSVIYRDKRVGKGGKEYYCYKFRSMVYNSTEILKEVLAGDERLREEWERYSKLKNDPRVTRVGKVIRKYSLDELPQIFNVIKGEMSFVGPRPCNSKEKAQIQGYDATLLVSPGITGFWQVNGRSDVEFVPRMEMEFWYVRNWSLWLDFIILIRTVPVVLKAKGAS